jgi:hypothetical protein
MRNARHKIEIGPSSMAALALTTGDAFELARKAAVVASRNVKAL